MRWRSPLRMVISLAITFATALGLLQLFTLRPCRDLRGCALRLAIEGLKPRALRVLRESQSVVEHVSTELPWLDLPRWARFGLGRIARDDREPSMLRQDALFALMCTRFQALSEEDALAEVASGTDSHLAMLALNTLGPSGSAKGIEALERRLASADPTDRLFAFWSIGEAQAAALAPRLIEMLRSDEWDIRAAAALALGRSGRSEAVGPLIEALAAPSFAIQLAAVDGLGDLGPIAGGAVPALEEVSKQHWLPYVRTAAAEAASAIRAGHRRANGGRPAWSVLPRCPHAAPGARAILPATTWLRPTSSMDVEGGILSGVDNGEFTDNPETGLHFKDKFGRSTQLIHHENVRGLLSLGREVIALTGLRHMGIDIGRAWKVTRDESGKWSARPWLDLLGEARQVGIDAENGLRVRTGFGSMRVAADGSITYLACE